MARLSNAPLQEVIFEVRWGLRPGENNGQMEDIGFELATGRLSTILEDKFSVYRRIVPAEIPDQMLFYRVVHQYWSGENQWPVIQLGPGIFTINCTDHVYDWEEIFRPLINEAIRGLMQSYRNPIQLVFASLRYIDAIKTTEFSNHPENWQQFIKNNFNLEYNNFFDTRGQQKGIQIEQTFELEDRSELQLQIGSGTKNNEPAVIWQTTILKREQFTVQELLKWADYAHNITHDLFVEMIKPDLYASFGGKN
jgi:uncharacterized protein (TIGR04255 family)